MMTARKWFRALVVLCGVLLLGVACSAKKPYPSRPVELVIPWPAGGSHDAHARVIASSITDYLGQPMVVAVKAGGGGAVGATDVAQAKPDGYKLLLGDQTSVIIRPLIEKVSYSWQDFTPIAQINDSPILFVTRSDRPWKNLQEFVAAAKASPGKITYGSVAGLGPDQVPMELFRLKAGLDLKHVPFEGGGPSYRAVLAGDTDVAPLFAATVRKDLQEGRLRALAVTSPERLKEFPDVPTLKELGYDVEWAMFRTVFGPKGMAPEVVEKLQKEVFIKLSQDAGFTGLIGKLGENVNFLTGKELSDRIAREAKVLEQLVMQLK